MNNSFKKKLVFLITGILLVFTANFLFERHHNEEKIELEKQKFQEKLNKFVSVGKGFSNDFIAFAETKKAYELFQSENILFLKAQKLGFNFFIFESNQLVYWSDNIISTDQLLNSNDGRKIELIKNGWYLIETKTIKNRTYIVSGLIKTEFPKKNSFLKNEFNPFFEVNVPFEISNDELNINETIFLDKVNKAFCLNAPKRNQKLKSDAIHIFLFSIGLLIIVLAIYSHLNEWKFRFSPFNPILFASIVFTLRYWMIELKFPEALYTTPLFGPELYASSFFLSSLGDLLINVCLIFLSILIFKSSYFKARKFSSWQKKIIAFGALSINFIFIAENTEIIIGLIENSNISLNINYVFELNVGTSIAVFCISTLLFAVFIASHKTISVVKYLVSLKEAIYLTLLSFFTYLIFQYLFKNFDVLNALWFIPIFSLMFIQRFNNVSKYSFAIIIYYLFVFSLFSAYSISHYSEIKEKRNRIVLADKISTNNDPLAEYLFTSIAKKIKSDSLFIQKLNNIKSNEGLVQDYLNTKYFKGFWNKFNKEYYFCKKIDSLSPQNIEVTCSKYFEKLIEEKGNQVKELDLFFVNEGRYIESYIAKIDFEQSIYNLYIVLIPRQFPKGFGYPELLLNQDEIKENPINNNYSYAFYEGGKLKRSFGKYNYNFIPQKDWKNIESGNFHDNNGFSHLILRLNPQDIFVISIESNSWIDYATKFSYLFIFFGIFLFIYILFWYIPKGIQNNWQDLKGKIQTVLIGTLVFSLLLLSFGTIYYIRSQYDAKYDNVISEKVQSILYELKLKLGQEEILHPDMNTFLNEQLEKLSNIFFTDLNIYSLNGKLLASSRPEIFEIGLNSENQNPQSYEALHINGNSFFLHNEKIGSLNFKSAYIPLINDAGKKIAYLNLPYFAKQNELEREISLFLVPLINVYVFIFLISIIISVIISDFITKPLRLLSNKLKTLSFSQKNETIEWQTNDELGELIAQYNRMVFELEESANLLARSERENAWKQMAKQVAHEIKNPLTPMKLSIQFLERAWNDNDSQFADKLNRFSKTLIQQIETLSQIANEFSTFANMPSPNPEIVDLIEEINTSIDLFKTTENVNLSFDNNLEKAQIWIDPKLISRVLINLLKNAIQAIPNGKLGEINIKIQLNSDFYTVIISDNGVGMNEEIKSKIFTPSFTTKSSGMGLGLAMVKNIVELSNGEIWFETAENVGTKFYLKFKVYC